MPNSKDGIAKMPAVAKQSVPQWDNRINEFKKEKIRALKIYRQNKTIENHNSYKKPRNEETNLIKMKKRKHMDKKNQRNK